MPNAQAIGVIVALCGAPALLLITRHFRIDALRYSVRLGMWLLTAVVLLLARSSSTDWRASLGLIHPGAATLIFVIGGTLLALAGWPIVQAAQHEIGGTQVVDTEPFQKLIAIPLARRVFLILTAGITEEVLYRGYAIGVGTAALGSIWIAAALSLLLFIGAHFRWGVSHLASVAWVGLILTAIFVLTGDLIACMICHTLVDGVGLILAPAAMAMKAKHGDAGGRSS